MWKGDNQEVLKFPPHYDLDGKFIIIYQSLYYLGFVHMTKIKTDPYIFTGTVNLLIFADALFLRLASKCHFCGYLVS